MHSFHEYGLIEISGEECDERVRASRPA